MTSVCGVRLTHADRVLFPEQGATKLDLARYYERACSRMLPFLDKRPLTLVRCPEGRGAECFYQRHAGRSVPAEIGRLEIREQSGKVREYLFVDSVKGLVATAQIGALELHVWGARSDRLERPERLVFDLDPDPELPFGRVRDAAFELKDVLDQTGLQSFPLLTGGKGIHVVVPMRRIRPWGEAKQFTKSLATMLAEAAPDRYVATAAKAARRGRIYIDWLRNDRGATAIAPYSPRSKPGAPVAVPVDWQELGDFDTACPYSLANIDARLAEAAAVWGGYFSVRQSVTRRHLAAVTGV